MKIKREEENFWREWIFLADYSDGFMDVYLLPRSSS